MEFIANLFGALGIVCCILIYQQKAPKKLLAYKLLADAVWAIHYLLLGAYSGFAIACIGVMRDVVFIKVDRRSRTGVAWLSVFALCSVVSSMLTATSIFSLLPAVASLTSVVSFYMAIPKYSRFLALLISTCMGVYDFTVGSYIGIANELITVTSAIVGLILLDRKAKDKEQRQDKA